MRMTALTCAALGMGILLSSCSEEELAPREYAQFVEDPANGLRISREADGFVYELQYKPVDYVLVNELRKEQVSKDEYEKTKAQLDGMLYFNLDLARLHSGQKHDVISIEGAESALQFSFRDKLKLVINNQEIACGLYHFQHGQGVKPYSTLVLGFEYDSEGITDLELIIGRDDRLGNTETRLIIPKESIENLPKLKVS